MTSTDRARWLLPATALSAALASVLKVVIAAHTTGTDDAVGWAIVGRAMAHEGPYRIYHLTFHPVYNHGPLSSWMVVAANWFAAHTSVDFLTLIRVPSSVADTLTGVLVFLLLRSRIGEVRAAATSTVVVWSPAAVCIAGFHGNTDPFFVSLVLLALWLVHDRRRFALAGVVFGLAISIKLVPIVVLPWLLHLCWTRGRAAVTAFVAGGATVFLVLWVPVLLVSGPSFTAHVLMYRGMPVSQWGIAQLLSDHQRYGTLALVSGQGSLVVTLLAAAAPFVLLRRVPEEHRPVAGVGLSLVMMLTLSPAFGIQYLAWALAAAYLVAPRVANLYNLAASSVVLVVYSQWSDAAPGHWDRAVATLFTGPDVALLLLTWICLLGVIGAGVLPRPRAERTAELQDPLPSDHLLTPQEPARA